eukprot:194596-Prorocentrum_minimum.AAC.9
MARRVEFCGGLNGPVEPYKLTQYKGSLPLRLCAISRYSRFTSCKMIENSPAAVRENISRGSLCSTHLLAVPHYGYIRFPLLRLVQAMGIFALPFYDWCKLWVYSLSPCLSRAALLHTFRCATRKVV